LNLSSAFNHDNLKHSTTARQRRCVREQHANSPQLR